MGRPKEPQSVQERPKEMNGQVGFTNINVCVDFKLDIWRFSVLGGGGVMDFFQSHSKGFMSIRKTLETIHNDHFYVRHVWELGHVRNHPIIENFFCDHIFENFSLKMNENYSFFAVYIVTS